MAVSTFGDFAGDALEVMMMMKAGDRCGLMQNMLAAYRAYLGASEEREEERFVDESRDSKVVFNGGGVGLRSGSAVTYSDPMAVSGHVRVPSPVWSDVSVQSSASTGRAALRVAQRGVQAMSCISDDLSYTMAPVALPLAAGYCYLSLLQDRYVAEAKGALGSYPTFGEVLSLPESWLIPLWALKKVSSFSGAYHVADTGMVSVRACLISVACRAKQWPDGSVGASLLGRELEVSTVIMAKAPAVTDLLGGRAAEHQVVGCELGSLSDRVETLLTSDLPVVALKRPFEARYLTEADVSLAIVFQGCEAVGVVPLKTLEVGHVMQVCMDLMTSDGDPKLVCYGTGGLRFSKEELSSLRTTDIPWKAAMDAALLERTYEQALVNLGCATGVAEVVWGRKMMYPRGVCTVYGDDSVLWRMDAVGGNHVGHRAVSALAQSGNEFRSSH